MAYKSNAAAITDALRKGIDAGLTAAAENYTTKVRARLDKGYTTGNFSHHAGGVAGRVMYTKPHDVPGGRAVTTGTAKSVVPYELFWEVGHRNAFTRRFERVEVWRPLLEANRELLTQIIARNIARYAGGATFTVAFG